MPGQIREILASVRETGDRGRNTGAPGKYGRSGNPRPMRISGLCRFLRQKLLVFMGAGLRGNISKTLGATGAKC